MKDTLILLTLATSILGGPILGPVACYGDGQPIVTVGSCIIVAHTGFLASSAVSMADATWPTTPDAPLIISSVIYARSNAYDFPDITGHASAEMQYRITIIAEGSPRPGFLHYSYDLECDAVSGLGLFCTESMSLSGILNVGTGGNHGVSSLPHGIVIPWNLGAPVVAGVLSRVVAAGGAGVGANSSAIANISIQFFEADGVTPAQIAAPIPEPATAGLVVLAIAAAFLTKTAVRTRKPV